MKTISTIKLRKVRRYPVLVVENDPDQWLILRSALAQCFPEIEPVWKNHTSQAITYLETASANVSTTPRLIFLNPFAPSLKEGWDFLAQVKSDSGSIRIPVIVLSYSDDPQVVLDAYRLSAATYITKPLVYSKLLLDFYTLKRYWWEMVKLPVF